MTTSTPRRHAGGTALEEDRRPPRGRSAGRGTVTGTRTLVLFMLRRDRIRLPLWVGGLGLYIIYIGAALPQLAPDEAGLAGSAMLFESPVGRMWVGPAFGMDEVTFERFFAAAYVLYVYILAALMNILLIARHTRAEEQSGRAEVVRANVVGRHAPLTAALIVAGVANVAAMVVVAGLAVANGYATEGSLLVGVATGLTGMAFAAITAVTVQLGATSRSAAGLAGGILGLAFMVRAVGDMLAVGGSALSWASPLGWASQTAPYVHDRWWPLLLLVLLGVACVTGAFALQSRRDLGASMLAVRPGRVDAAPSLGTPLGLAARLQRGAMIGWGVVIVLFGLVDGVFAQAMLDAAEEMPPLLLEVFGTGGLEAGYIAFLSSFSGYVTAAYVVFAVQALVTEESRGRAEILLATPTSRSAWAGSHFAVVALGSALILVVAGVVTGAAIGAVTGTWSAVADSTLAHLNMVPPTLVVIGVVAALFGWAPRLLVVVGWALVGLIIFVGVFASLVDLPQWVLDLSPFSHPAQLPVEDFSLLPLVWLTLLAAAGVAIGLVGLRRRQVVNRG
jgi:ABC-2 type transport system permease protein